MTGIERLRGVAGFWRENKLDNIVEQIERETEEWNDALEDENERLRDMLNQVAWHLGLEESVHYYSDDNYQSCQKAVLAAIDSRLMPEGYEWPRYESGELVMLGDTVTKYIGGGTIKVRSVEFLENMTYLHERFKTDQTAIVRRGERVKRPPVLAADGEPLEVGQTVWDTDAESDTPLTVVDVSIDLVRCEYTWKDGKTYRPCYPPSALTHQLPVMDADGVPIREGDTVYWLEHTVAFTVVSPHETHDNEGHELKCGHTVEIAREGHRPHMYVHPESLSHTKPEPPDSWERIEEDIAEGFMATEETTRDLREEARDIVRRAKKLAGVDND